MQFSNATGRANAGFEVFSLREPRQHWTIAPDTIGFALLRGRLLCLFLCLAVLFFKNAMGKTL